jgi:hypothetical protein
MIPATLSKQEADAIRYCEGCNGEELTQESAVYGTTARHTVSCDECGWCVEFDGRVRPAY